MISLKESRGVRAVAFTLAAIGLSFAIGSAASADLSPMRWGHQTNQGCKGFPLNCKAFALPESSDNDAELGEAVPEGTTVQQVGL